MNSKLSVPPPVQQRCCSLWRGRLSLWAGASALNEGKVSGITNFGVFVDIGEGITGMVHISEVARNYVKDIKEYVRMGQEVKVKVITVSPEGKVSLSMKQAK